jgi:hypothetical protein
MKEKATTTCTIYPSDLEKVRKFREQKNLKNLADVLRIAIEYSQAHGVFE